jgi:hypothetical protein
MRILIVCSMKHDAIVEQGIPIHERVPIPDDMIPADSRVEIDAKIQAGYCKHYPLYANAIWMSQSVHANESSCSHNRPCHVHGRAGQRQGPWLGGHRCTCTDSPFGFAHMVRMTDSARSTEQLRHDGQKVICSAGSCAIGPWVSV